MTSGIAPEGEIGIRGLIAAIPLDAELNPRAFDQLAVMYNAGIAW